MSVLTKQTIAFRAPTLDDADLINSYLNQVHEMGCEYTFFNIFLWASHYRATFSIVEDFLIIRTEQAAGCYSYAYPIGAGDPSPALQKLMELGRNRGCPFHLHGLTAPKVAVLEQLFPGQFEVTPQRNSFDYLYEVERLTTLTGKKYHAKRNYINRFIAEHPDWTYEPLSEDNRDECLALATHWYQSQEQIGHGQLAELTMIQQALDWLEPLHLKGGVLRSNRQVVAFSVGEPINDEVFVVHIEKAYADIPGAYPMINREFLKHTATSHRYVNREEDLGLEGLRKAKLSYHPQILLEKHTACWRPS